MKNKLLIKMTLVTLLAPSLLNAQQALAAETPTTKAPVEVAVPPAQPVTPPVAELPKEEQPVTAPPVVEAPKQETPAPLPAEVVPEAPVEAAPMPEAAPAPEATPTPEVTPTAPGELPTPGDDDIAQIPGESGEAGAPTLSVNPSKTIKKGSKYDPMEGVYAYDNDGNATSRVTVVHNVNTAVATPEGGTPYQATYTVASKDGLAKTVKTIDVYVIDDDVYGMLTASISDFTIAQNGDINAEIKKRLVVKDHTGKVAAASDYTIKTNGSAGGGDAGVFPISIVVTSLKYNTSVETTVKVTVIKGLTLSATDKTILVGDVFDEKAHVTAIEHQADGSSKALGDYDGGSDSGLSIIGSVNTAVEGDYPITYTAKSISGVSQSVSVTITVRASVLTLTVDPAISIMQGETFVASQFVTAQDEKDGDLSGKVTSTPFDSNVQGTYPVTFEVTNSAGTTVSETVNVTVTERKSTITVDNQEVYQGQEVTQAMVESWAVVTDPVEKNLKATAKISSGSIDTTVPGSVYQVTYTVTNSTGVTTEAVITVTVKERQATINAVDQRVQPGDKITDAMILAWATASDPVQGDNMPVTEFKLLNGKIDTSKPGSVYGVRYSFTNSVGNTTTKDIKVTVAEFVTPTLEVSDQVMYVGDKITEQMVLEWAKVKNAESVSFEIVGKPIQVTAVGSNLVEAGVHQIKFTAHAGVTETNAKTRGPLATVSNQDVSKTITLTVKEQRNTTQNNGSNGTNKGTISTSNKKAPTNQTKSITKAKKALPKTGEQETSLMMSVMGMIMVVVYYFSKKKKDEFEL